MNLHPGIRDANQNVNSGVAIFLIRVVPTAFAVTILFYTAKRMWHLVRTMTTDPQPGRTEPDGPSRRDAWRMFDRIAPRYDLLNRLMTFGLDVSWRRRMARYLPDGADLDVLDLATGTADQVLLLCDACDRIQRAVGMDLSENMLAIGRRKVAERGREDRIELIRGDAMSIPAPDTSFDAVTISYGIRNVTDVVASLRDMLRVLKPGGRVLILEGSLPANPVLRVGNLLYLRCVMPILGGLVSGDFRAYRYLNKTIETFPCGAAFCALLDEAGFVEVRATPVTFGASTIYRGDRPAEAGR